MIDYGVEELLDRKGRKLLADCRQEAPGFRIGVEELPGGPTYVCRAIVGGVEIAEGHRVRDCCRARLYPGLPPQTIGDDLAVLLCSMLEAIREAKAT